MTPASTIIRKHIHILRELNSRPEVIKIAEDVLAKIEHQEVEAAEDEGVIRVLRRHRDEAEDERDAARVEVVRLEQELLVSREVSNARLRGFLASQDALAAARAEVTRLQDALERITKIENKYSGTDWDEIDEARQIARAALASGTTAQNDEATVARLRESIKKARQSIIDAHAVDATPALRILDDALISS